jgi:tungstate transport system ATP-binding protein
MTNRLETVDLTKDYAGVLALDRVSVSAKPAQITSIVGVNGAGKTTLLKVLAGLIAPTTGKILIDGREHEQDQLRSRCTMVFQRTVMFGSSVYDNVAYGLRINRTPNREIPERVQSALAVVNLEGFEKRRARRLSSGEQQRVAIARALALDRGILLFDEPTANLDPANSMIIERAIRESAQTKLVLLSTHNLSQARRLSDRVVHLYRGRVVEEGVAHQFFAKPSDERTKLFINGELQF